MIYFTFGCMGNIHFTFQSGYIQIITGKSPTVWDKIFTFQSGYIQIVTNADDRNTQLTLHSNLVIFKCLQNLTTFYQINPLHSNLVIFKLYTCQR